MAVPKIKPMPDLNLLREHFEVVGGDLIRLKKTNNRVNIGDRVGYTDNKGYRLFTFQKKTWLVSRVIYYMETGTDPGELFVDHIDGNPSNNNISNLQLLNNQQNQHKSKVCKNNPQSINGVLTEYGKKKHAERQLQYRERKGAF